jgi:hypothetical protein
LSKDKRLVLLLSILATALIVPVAWLLAQAFFTLNDAARAVFPSFEASGDGDSTFAFSAWWIVHLVVAQVLVIVIHEAVHGAFFWLFTRARPHFGFKGLYAYAALPPGMYLPRNPYIVVGLAPLVLLTLLGLLLVPVTPPVVIPTLYLFVLLNAVGAVGDLLVTAWLLRYPSTALAQDVGDAMTVFAPAEKW